MRSFRQRCYCEIGLITRPHVFDGSLASMLTFENACTLKVVVGRLRGPACYAHALRRLSKCVHRQPVPHAQASISPSAARPPGSTKRIEILSASSRCRAGITGAAPRAVGGATARTRAMSAQSFFILVSTPCNSTFATSAVPLGSRVTELAAPRFDKRAIERDSAWSCPRRQRLQTIKCVSHATYQKKCHWHLSTSSGTSFRAPRSSA